MAQRISMRRNGLRQSRVNAFDTMLAVRGSGSLEKLKVRSRKYLMQNESFSKSSVSHLNIWVISGLTS